MAEAATVKGIEDALRECGVTDRTLAPREKEALDRQGYLVLPGVMDRKWVATLREAVDTAVAQGARHGQHVPLPWHEEIFDRVHTQPRVLAAVFHVLRRSFCVSPPVSRAPLPGFGLQALHPDWGRAASEPFQVVTALWLLDDFTPHNGATRVIPGSHLVPRPVPKALLQPERRHPDQKIIVAEAGSVLLFNAHLLHSGTRNESDGPRRVLQIQYRARDAIHPGESQTGIPEQELPQRFSAAARYLLGGGGGENGG